MFCMAKKSSRPEMSSSAAKKETAIREYLLDMLSKKSKKQRAKRCKAC